MSLVELSHKIENLRAAAATDQGFDDKRYREAYVLTTRQIEDLEKKPKRKLDETVGLLHFYVMASTICQSRANHTLETDEEKVEALNTAANILEKAEDLAKILTQKEHWVTIDGSPFFWQVEICRGWARTFGRYPFVSKEQTAENLKKSLDKYKEAVTLATKRVGQVKDKELKAAALSAKVTSQIEVIQTLEKMKTLTREQLGNDLPLIYADLNRSWQMGYRNFDRFDVGLARMIRLLVSFSPDNSLLGGLVIRRLEVLKEITNSDREDASIAEERWQGFCQQMEEKASKIKNAPQIIKTVKQKNLWHAV